MTALGKHRQEPWIRLYVERWLEERRRKAYWGQLPARDKGAPQGGVWPIYSCTLRSIFWVTRHLPGVRFARCGQFTRVAFTGVLLNVGVSIGMDGECSWRDNVFVERLWRRVKYEEFYLKADDSVSEARGSLADSLAFHNQRRPHSSLDRRTPNEAYFQRTSLAVAA